MGDGFLHKYFLNNAHKRLHKWMHYFDIYERHFERFRGNSPTMLEIGVAGGGSLPMWKAYFGPGAKIIGLDINPKCKVHAAPDIEVFVGSQDDPDVLNSILNSYPNIDIVLDDGSHQMKHMIDTFKLLYGRTSTTGVYMVEDTHTCYWPQYEGGLKREGSFIEFVKDRFDELNAVHVNRFEQNPDMPVSDFTRSTDSISLYDSIVVFEKRPQGSRQMPITAAM